MEYYNVKKCRACGSNKLKEYLDLGMQPLANNYHMGDSGKLFPLKVFVCENCFHSQLGIVVNPSVMFDHYLWVSGTTDTSRKHFNELAKYSLSMAHKKDNVSVLDIASNDCSLLDEFRKLGCSVFGVDPAKNLQHFAKEKNIDVDVDYWSFEKSKEYINYFDIITATNVFAHDNDHIGFLKGCKNALKEDGIIVIEFPYNKDTIKNYEFDQVYCFPEDSIVLGDNKRINDYRIGDKVFNQHGVFSSVEKYSSRHYEGKMVEINPRYLERIKTTPEHMFLTVQKDVFYFPSGQLRRNVKDIEFKWMPAQKLNQKDCLVIPKLYSDKGLTLSLKEFNNKNSNWRRGLENITVNEDIAWLFGLYISDGSISEDKRGIVNISIALNNTEIDTIGIKLEKVINRIGYRVNKTNREKYGSKCTTYGFTCTALGRAFRQWFGHKATEKKIPDFLMMANNNIKRGLLLGLLDGDGYLDKEKNQINYHTSSRVLSLQIQLLVASFGCMLGISECPERDFIINGKKSRSNKSWLLRGRMENLKNIYNHDFLQKERTIRNNYFDIGNYICVPILSIKDIDYSGMVGNLKTTDESYLMSNVVTHNCEHLSYFTVKSFKTLVDSVGLSIKSVTRHSIHGGSIRFVLSKEGIEDIRVKEMIESEKMDGLHDLETYYSFSSYIKNNMEKFSQYVAKIKRNNGRIVGYGASAKSGTALNYANIHLDYMVDENELKQNRFTPGTNMMILHPNEIINEPEDLNVVITAWNFYDEIKEKIAVLRMGKRTILVRYIPEFEIEIL